MAGTLDYVQRGEAITAEKWNALVERINALEQRPSFGFGVSRRPKGGGDPLALVAIRGYYDTNPWGLWKQDSKGVWHMPTAKFVDETTLARGAEDVDVYMTRALDDRFKALGNSWFNRWAVYRNKRWELLDFQWTDRNTEYVGGSFISTTYDSDNLPKVTINNEGLCKAALSGGEITQRTLYFGAYFKRETGGVPGSDIVGSYRVALDIDALKKALGIGDS